MKWNSVKSAFERDDLFTSLIPDDLFLRQGSTVFTIGSCFAREIEDALSEFYDFPTLSYPHPPLSQPETLTGRPRGILNKFTPESILRELEWAKAFSLASSFDIRNFEENTENLFLYQIASDQCIDIGLHRPVPVTYNRFISRRRTILNIYRQLTRSDAIIVTLGNLEQAYLSDTRPLESLATNARFLRDEHKRLTIKTQTAKDVEVSVNEIVLTIRALNQHAKIIFSVSPVPMERTHRDRHILLANQENKLLLSQAAKRNEDSTKKIYYLPTYEYISFLGISAFRKDLRHVQPSVIKSIMRTFRGKVDY
mgnify:CR=1 FL=1